MKIGIISTTGGYEWAGSEELWYLTAMEALLQGNKITALIAPEMLNSRQVLHLKASGGKIVQRKKIIHPRLSKLSERLFSSYDTLISKQDAVLVSAGSPLDILNLPGLYQSLKKCKKNFLILLQFNADILTFSKFDRENVKDIMSFSKSNIFVSRNNLDLLKRQIASPISNSKVIYNPIKIKLDAPLKFPTEKVINFACIARLEILWKGHDVLLETLSGTVWHERNWHLNLYGTGPDQSYIIKLIQFFNLENKVTLHGHEPDVIEIWKKNSIMLLPSRGEGTSLAILEGMMCGRPVVTTDVGGNREIITENIHGWIAEAATSFSFGIALEKAWNQISRWREVGISAHEKSRSIVSENPITALLNEIYNSHGNPLKT